MSDSIPSQGSDALETGALASPPMPTPAPASAGTLLRQGRLAAGLHIAALAVSLKVPVRRLEALEGDRFDLLPDAVFVRALASSVCRALKMDARPVLALLPASAAPRLSAMTQRANDVYTSAYPGRGLAVWRSLPKPVTGAVAALLLATLALLVWPFVQMTWGAGSRPAADLALGADDAAKTAEGAAFVPVTAVASDVDVVTTVTVPLPAKAVSVPASLASAGAAVPAAPVVTAISAPTPSASGIVVFRPSAPSWVEVTDAKSAVVLRRMLTAGEVVGATGVLPLSVVIGRADVTQVQVRGQAFDLTSIARENVARFEVK